MTDEASASEDLYDLPEDVSTQTLIQNRYTFWCHKRGKQAAASYANYEEAMKQVGNFQTIEHFWRIYNHLLRPSEFKTNTDYHLFKFGIKPTWEDAQNERGGKWMVKLKKGLATRYWEELIIAIIGEQFDVGHEICGAVISVRNNEDIISVWNKNAENTEAKNKIRDQMRRILKLPAFINVEYKKHQDSIVDKSSFRNTQVWRSDMHHHQDRERGPRKSRADWNDRGGEQSGMERSHGYHHRNERSKDSRDSSGQEGGGPSPRGGFPARYNTAAAGASSSSSSDKDSSTTTTNRNWQQAAGNTSSSWKSPRSNYQGNKEGGSSSGTSPRFSSTSAWGSAGGSNGSKPSPTTTPSSSAGVWGTASSASKSDASSDSNTYVSLGGGSRQQGGSARTSSQEDGEQRKRGDSGGGSAPASENVWSRGKKSAVPPESTASFS